EDLESRSLATTSMESICRAIAFATLAYWIRAYLDSLEDWDEILTRTVGGWIARLVREGMMINAHGKSLEQICWAPVDSQETARELLAYLQARLGADKGLLTAYEHADAMLERNPKAPIPGWAAIETLLGVQAKIGIRRGLHGRIDSAVLERLSDRYVYDTSEHVFHDREALVKGLKAQHK